MSFKQFYLVQIATFDDFFVEKIGFFKTQPLYLQIGRNPAQKHKPPEIKIPRKSPIDFRKKTVRTHFGP